MQYRPQHIINKNTLKIKVKDMDTAKKINALARQMTSTMHGTFEKVLDACDTGETIRLDKIFIELNFSGIDDFSLHFTEQLEQQLIKILAEQLKLPEAEVHEATLKSLSPFAGNSPPAPGKQAAAYGANNHQQQENIRLNSIWDTFEYYLQKGHFPWWFTGSGLHFIEELQAVWPKNITDFSNNNITRLLEKPEKFQRFIQLIPGEKLGKWSVLLAGPGAELLYKTAQRAAKTLQTGGYIPIHTAFGWIFYTAFWLVQKKPAVKSQEIVSLLKFWIQKMPELISPANHLAIALEEYSNGLALPLPEGTLSIPEFISQMVQQVVNAAGEQKKKSKMLKKTAIKTGKPAKADLPIKNKENKTENTNEIPRPPDATERETEDIMIANAGLVLAWPFFSTAFKKLDLVEDGNFKDFHSRKQAVLFLHYLVYKAMPEDESPLYLNKLLCGVEPAEFISVRENAGEGWEELRTGLWKAVIQQWEVVKSTSVEGLVQTFVQRNGKVKPAPGGYNVLVERKTLDILVDRLPWPISIIKPAWNNYIITVTW